MQQRDRRSEAQVRTVEQLSAIAAVETVAPDPHDELTEIWEAVLLHQFHDILPGSSIAWVHREARATYQDLEQRLRGLADRAVELLADDEQPTAAARLAPRGDGTWQHRAVAETTGGARSASTATTSSPLEIGRASCRQRVE